MTDEEVRKEFGKILKFVEYTKEYGYTRTEAKIRTPSWPEIFVEVGKLLEHREASSRDVVKYPSCEKQLTN